MSGMDLLLHAAGYTSASDDSTSSISSTGSSATNNNNEEQKQRMKDNLYSNFVSAITFQPSSSSNSKALTRSGSNMSLPPKKRMKLGFRAARSSASKNNIMTNNEMFQSKARSESSLSTLGHSIISNGAASHCFSGCTDSPTLNSEWTSASLQKSTGNNNIFKSLGLTNNMIIAKNKKTSSSSSSSNKRKISKSTATEKNSSRISPIHQASCQGIMKMLSRMSMVMICAWAISQCQLRHCKVIIHLPKKMTKSSCPLSSSNLKIILMMMSQARMPLLHLLPLQQQQLQALTNNLLFRWIVIAWTTHMRQQWQRQNRYCIKRISKLWINQLRTNSRSLRI